ncbi:MAG: alpha/beta hydrolase [Flavobacteriaceae bacterium]|nr:MAG: alpha/beta hydrolase [Flavobacteriaceae bacterium]
MKLKLVLLCFCIISAYYARAQQVALKKGSIINTLKISDSIPESFSLYLPTNFETSRNWPVLFVFDVEGKGKQAMSMFRQGAEEFGYILVSSNNVHDSLNTSQNILIANRMFNKVFSMFPIQKRRVYTAGFSNGARLASIVPLFIKNIEGVISCGANIRTVELLNTKNTFHFIGIVGREDYNYQEMIAFRKILNRMKFPNLLLKFEGGHQWPTIESLTNAMKILTLASMSKGSLERDDSFVNTSFEENNKHINNLISSNNLLIANELLEETITVYRPYSSMDSLKEKRKLLKRNKWYRTLKRNEDAALFKETLIKENYAYSLEEDVLAYNYNNLGWWNYQMVELKKYVESDDKAQQQMGKRLWAYINALTEDTIEILESEEKVEEEGVRFLWMLKTITAPNDYSYYLKIISDSARIEDYGTALFYLEEALKNGYKNKGELYTIAHTALLRITPEFNQIVAKYLKEARYDIIEE